MSVSIGGFSADPDDGGLLKSGRHITRSPDGNLHAVWNSINSDAGIWYSVSTDNGDTWSPSHVVISSGTSGKGTAIVSDSNNNVYIVYGDGSNVYIKKRFSDGSWGTSEIISSTAITWGTQITITIDSSDNICVCWSCNGKVYCVTGIMGSWSEETVWDDIFRSYVQAIYDYDDNLHIVAGGSSVYYSYNKGPFETVCSTSSSKTSFVVDSSNIVHILLQSTTSLKHTWGTSGSWNTETVHINLDSMNVEQYELGIDTSDKLYALYKTSPAPYNDPMRLRTKTSLGSWSGETTLTCISTVTYQAVNPSSIFSPWPKANSAEAAVPETGFGFIYEFGSSIYWYSCDDWAPPDWPDPCYLKFIAVCNFNGQFLIGGIQTSGVDKYSQWGLNTVAWAQIGRFDFDYGSETSKTAGFMHMPWNGTVLKLTKLGNHVVVYGTNGMSMLRPISEPISGYGLVPLSMPGIRSGFHCAGDSTIQGFVDIYGYWWTVTQDGKFTRWGYKEFLSQLSDPFKVTFDQTLQRFFISDGSTCYVFNQYGMATVRQQVTSCGPGSDGEVVGICGSNDDYDVRVITDVMDYGTRGLKTITTMEAGIDVDATSAVKLAVDYRYDKRLDFTRSDWNLTNKRGGTGIMKTAVEFRLGVLVEAGFYSVGSAVEKSVPEVNLDYILATVQISDKRMIRGVFAQQGGGEDASSSNA